MPGDPVVSEIVTLELPEPLAESTRVDAARTSRPVEAVLVEWLDRAAAELPIDSISDEQVLALRDLQMSETQQEELSTRVLAGWHPPSEWTDLCGAEHNVSISQSVIYGTARLVTGIAVPGIG
jgi:hypothetical protein